MLQSAWSQYFQQTFINYCPSISSQIQNTLLYLLILYKIKMPSSLQKQVNCSNWLFCTIRQGPCKTQSQHQSNRHSKQRQKSILNRHHMRTNRFNCTWRINATSRCKEKRRSPSNQRITKQITLCNTSYLKQN
jgi:hypothetical protein